MYTGKFTFYILSKSSQPEKILSGVAPLEDCEYIFKTVDSLDFPLDIDCAVIIDGGADLISAACACNPTRLAAIIPASELQVLIEVLLRLRTIYGSCPMMIFIMSSC